MNSPQSDTTGHSRPIADRLLSWLARHPGGATGREIARAEIAPADATHAALVELLATGSICRADVPATARGGRPCCRYSVTPATPPAGNAQTCASSQATPPAEMVYCRACRHADSKGWGDLGGFLMCHRGNRANYEAIPRRCREYEPRPTQPPHRLKVLSGD